MRMGGIGLVIGLVLSNLGAILFAIALIAAYVRVRQAHVARVPVSTAEILLRRRSSSTQSASALLWYGTFHAFFQDYASRMIGWLPSPFERELGFMELAVGVAAIVSRRRSYDMRLAITIIFALFSFGAAAQHIYLIVCCGNMAPGNAWRSSSASTWIWPCRIVLCWLSRGPRGYGSHNLDSWA